MTPTPHGESTYPERREWPFDDDDDLEQGGRDPEAFWLDIIKALAVGGVVVVILPFVFLCIVWAIATLLHLLNII